MLSRQDLSNCTPLGITLRAVQLHAGDLRTFVHGMHLGAEAQWLANFECGDTQNMLK